MAKRVKKSKQTSILSYWTIRYFLILCVGFLIIAAAAVYWVRDTAMDNRLKTAGLLGQEVADRVTSDNGTIVIPQRLDGIIQNRLKFFNLDEYMCIMIANEKGQFLFSMPNLPQDKLSKKLTPDLAEPTDKRYMAVNTPIFNEQGVKIGQVTLLQSKKSLTYSPNEIILVVVLLSTLIISGWLTIYWLSRKLSRPIQLVADAAKQIRAGNYDVNLDIDTREQEITELVQSFEEMAQRLKQLEEWRALSLAGVTHELKTPVTSIKGLVMAVREEVVTQDEAKEFLDIALKESDRMERMIADLLDYNAFTSGSVEIQSDRLHLQLLISEIAYQWKITHEAYPVDMILDLPEEPLYTMGDSLRIQQIFVNLLNNGLQAVDKSIPIQFRIRMYAEQQYVHVEVTDNGTGVAPEDQSHIFERFYRGDCKKRSVRGLGLGLTYSQLLARAQGGELRLRQSSSAGSTFALQLPR
ncbi:HAMP domain-containing sensor histidine kinase [Paenibacillus sp. PK4536]|uniref:HAMP domain-containing sensor histidine kinase n=1 Tax=Paenibacillus sp. PK4536 TaxID=3024576 RepID=UPI002358BF61|nr:HAMP domain-containing sensor histidine kinase [Paenibacillus sp. PK4536]WIM38675.1 HAMP domain-containing sensor histidine kinase [Paenibacillus sp. PK4536]